MGRVEWVDGRPKAVLKCPNCLQLYNTGRLTRMMFERRLPRGALGYNLVGVPYFPVIKVEKLEEPPEVRARSSQR